MKTKFRFVATSDWHSNLNVTNAIEKYVDFDSIDFVIMTGDISENDNDFEKLFKPFKDKQIFFVPGNHESDTAIESLIKHYSIHLVGNSPVKINNDIAIFGTNYLSVGPFGIPEQEVLDNMVQNFKAIEDVPIKIQLNHIPPIDTEIGDASPFPFITGSPALRIFLDNFSPDITFVGHIHETSGLEEIVNKTRVINTAFTFKVFEVDTEKKEIKEVSSRPVKKKATKKRVIKS